MAYGAVVVCPGFPQYDHPSGLYWDTRLRLQAAAILYQQTQTSRIIVGGDRLLEMKDSYANLMEKYLVEVFGVPTSDITKEEYTFDTSSQFEWLAKHIGEFQGPVAVITDAWQAMHVKALLRGFRLQGIDVVTVESIGLRSQYGALGKIKWALRETILAGFTSSVDPQGLTMQKITSSRKK
ncbi:MAG: YdcF family protein [Candidatus Doudnabacteria bacterium]|nr:YdcF family protein [Candidatus Doudnabacteria bacterium]